MGFPCSSAGKELACNARDPRLIPWVRKISWRRDRLPTPVFLGLSCGSHDKESACNAGDMGSIPGLGRSPGEGNGYPLQYSGLENCMDYSPWGCKESDRTERLSLSLHCFPSRGHSALLPGQWFSKTAGFPRQVCLLRLSRVGV